MCLTSDAVYRIRDADAIFRIERKDDQKIAQNSQLFYRKYFEITSNTSGRARGTLWRIVSKYIFCLRMVQSFYRRYFQNTTNNVTGAQEDHDRSRYAAYSVKGPSVPHLYLLQPARCCFNSDLSFRNEGLSDRWTRSSPLHFSSV